MAFSDIPKIETKDWYLDLAFRRARKQSSQVKNQTRGGRLETVRAGEVARVKEIRRVLTRHMGGILKSFPSMDSLTEFYNELVRTTLEYSELKKSLGAVNWAKEKIEQMSGKYIGKLKKCQHLRKISEYSKEYYGRISSVMRQIKKRLEYLEKARLVMRGYPSIKSGMFTVCIAGFPNVGKTTLLTKLTPSRPEISDYAFTTKKLNVGYADFGHEKVQFIDTPGTLNRKDKMNMIELQAHLAMKYCADVIVYVVDPTEQAATLKSQRELLKKVAESRKPVIVYFSKTDILQNDDLPMVKQESTQDLEALKSLISARMA